MYRRSYKFNDNLSTSKETKIYHKLNVSSVAYQQRIGIVFHFNSKLNDCQNEVNVQGKLANKTVNPTVSFKHHTGRTLVQIK